MLQGHRRTRLHGGVPALRSVLLPALHAQGFGLLWLHWDGLLPMTEAITPEDIRAAIEMAADREQVRDQLGRRWCRWYAGHPSCMERCSKCHRLIECGYLLVGAEHVKLCPRHVEHRWV